MNASPVRVAINGYGVIGKRVADAVALQDDMVVAGVVDVVTDYRIQLAVERGHALYGATAEARDALAGASLPVKGGLEDLLGKADVVVDCTPKKVAATNRELYAARKVKSIFQGGEKHELTGCSFVAEANYAGAIGRDTLRVVSCNTTGLCRIARDSTLAGSSASCGWSSSGGRPTPGRATSEASSTRSSPKPTSPATRGRTPAR